MKKHTYWWDLSPQNNAYYDSVPSEAEVVIIGAGIAGISAAYWLLTNKQKSVIIIDESPFPGYKGAGRELGMLLAAGGMPYNTLIDRLGQERADIYLELTRSNNRLLKRFIKRNKIPCKFESNGGLRLAGCIKEAEDLVTMGELLNEFGIPAVPLSETEIESIVPSNRLHGGLYIPGEGMLDPFALLSFVSRILQESVGLRFCHSVGKVMDVECSARGAFRHVNLENGHSIKCRTVIHANNHTAPVGDILIPGRQHAIANQELPDNIVTCFPRMPMLINGGDDNYRLNDGTLLMSGGSTSETLVTNDVSSNSQVYNLLATNAARVFPLTTMVGHTHAWPFISTGTPDGLPLIGALPNDDKQFVISGLGSHRYSVGFIAGRLVAAQLHGKKYENLEIFQPGRFSS